MDHCHRLGLTFLCILAACGSSAPAGDDDAGPPLSDAGPTLAEEFDHFTVEVSPAYPVVSLVDEDFEVDITAYSSADDTVVMDNYDGTLTLTTSTGTLTGGSAQSISNGTATITVSTDTAGNGITLTAVDDDFSTMTGMSAPFVVSPRGDTATERQVVISEVNWFGNGDSNDEWIEIRNVSGSELNLSEWVISGAGSTGNGDVRLYNGTSLPDGDYLVIASKQGDDADGMRTSVTGVSPVQVHGLSLANAGTGLVLLDAAGTTIDQTPTGPWPAGDNGSDLTMERRDDLTGGGYSDGTDPDAWYSWSSLDGTDTTSADTTDRGTPGADNTDPDIFDHFGFFIQPTSPRASTDFAVTVTAYSSADDTVVIANYNGTVSVTASSGTLSGQQIKQPVTNGVATLTLRNNTVATDVTLTVTDDIYSHITGTTEPFEVLPEGDSALERQVVINEVNWFGNADTTDEWIEIRNVSGDSLIVAGWTLENAGTGGAAITIANGTVLADGAYLILADQKATDTSLDGVSNVQLLPVSLANGGEPLILRDGFGTLIDETPDPGWPAGNATADYSMERRDDVTGGGYTNGALDGAWYTWSSLDGNDTTSANSSDSGTPGADNTDPDIFDHFTFTVTPATPVVSTDFAVEVTAYSSADDSVAITNYTSTVSLTESTPGALSGEVTDQPITAGVGSFTVQFDRPATTLAITVTDNIYPAITGTTAAFNVIDTGDDATLGDVVISEVNWYGNAGSTGDEWIEIRNVSGGSLDLSGWTIDAAASGSNPAVIASGTILADGAYLVIADQQDTDDSVDGVTTVQVTSLSIGNTGEELILRDIDGTLIDQTPAGMWPAGNSTVGYSMERRDDITGGGYTDGSNGAAWYTWSVLDGSETTNANSSDRGTPGAANTDPDIFDHLVVAVSPATPTANTNFTVSVTAYSSADNSVVITNYAGTVSLTESTPGTLSGEVSNQSVTAGTGSFTVQFSTPAAALTITVTDDVYSNITGTSAAFAVTDTGASASVRDVVISELNWFGNNLSPGDEWIELRNITNAPIDISGWTIDGAASGANPITIASGTILGIEAYLVIADRQDTDTSVFGVPNVQVNSSISLSNTNESLILRDIDGTLIDQTPAGTWPAGDNDNDYSMERRDWDTGGGYTDGSVAGAWYTWSGAIDTTNSASSDKGTPGANNSTP